MESLRGAHIAGYRLVTELGVGGMGTVYFGEWAGEGSPPGGGDSRVAIKVLEPSLSVDPSIVARFFDEARAVAAIAHPNIVTIHRFGEESGRHYLIMELLEGETLAERLEREGKFPLADVRGLVRDIAAALDASHRRSVVHRDLKPENIFLTPDGAKVLDFGIAKLGEGLRTRNRTQTGTVLGTPAYMSPEQCIGDKNLGPASDLYSLAAVTYEMVTGQPPFTAESFGGYVLCHVRQPPPAPPGDLPANVTGALLRGLEKEPSDRFDTATDFFKALCEPAKKATPVPVSDPSAMIAAKLEDLMHKRIARGDLRLPSMPETATRALALLQPPVDFARVAVLIERDPLIAGHLLRVASSPTYGGRNITSIRQALPRFGVDPLREVLMQLAARSVFRSNHPRINDAFRQIWCHGVAVGNIARATAALVGGDDDAAYLAGLLHDVGKPVVGGFLLELERIGAAGRLDDGVWRRVVQRAHAPVGQLLSERWGLPGPVRSAIGQMAYLPGGRGSLANIVRYANSLVEREGIDLEPIDLTAAFEVAAAGRQLLGLSGDDEATILRALRHNLESLAPQTGEDRTIPGR
ncbi:MAG: HDOD domain-containing protein [Myxococcota bacterium]